MKWLRPASVLCGVILTVASARALPAQNPKNQAAAKQKSKGQTKAPHPLQELLDRAEAALAKDEHAVAVEALEKFIAEQPNDAYAHFHLGYAYTGLAQREKAIAAYRRAAELDPKLAAAHLNLGLILLDHGTPEAALEPLRRAVELLANEARPHFLLGMALERSGKTAEAIAAYRAAASLDPRDAETQLALGRTLLDSGSHAEAEAAFRQALALDEQKLAARLGLVQALLARQKLREAAAELESYVAAKPDDPQAWLQLASLRLDMESYDQALHAVDRAEAANCLSSESLRLRADIYQRQKRVDEAIVVLHSLLQKEPGNAALRGRLGRLLLEKRDFPAAERELLEALRLDPYSLDALRDLASVYYLAEKYEAALRAMDLLEQREPPTAGFWFIRATCYDKLWRKAEAIAAYEKFVELDQGRSQQQDLQARTRIRILKRELEKK